VIVDAELEDVGKPASAAAVVPRRAELLANINKHARAERRSPCGCSSAPTRFVMTVAGRRHRVRPNAHRRGRQPRAIGLGSLLVRFHAMGGSFDIDSAGGQGARG